MSQLQIASRYAKSLIDLATEYKQLAEVYEDVQGLSNVCKHPEFASMLSSPIVNSDKKSAVVQQLFSGKTSDLTLRFVQLLIQKGRESLLPLICSAFVEQYKTIKKIRTARVITAMPMSEQELNNVKSKFSHWLQPGETMELTQKADPRIIGGFLFEMGDRNYDATIKRQLDEMKENLYDKSYVSLVEKR